MKPTDKAVQSKRSGKTADQTDHRHVKNGKETESAPGHTKRLFKRAAPPPPVRKASASPLLQTAQSPQITAVELCPAEQEGQNAALNTSSKRSKSLGDLAGGHSPDADIDVSVLLDNLGMSQRLHGEDDEYVNHFLNTILDEDNRKRLSAMDLGRDSVQSPHDRLPNRTRKQIPVVVRKKERNIRKISKEDISTPYNFTHRQHVGYDLSDGFVMEGLDDETREAFERNLLFDNRNVMKRLNKCFDFLDNFSGSDDEVDATTRRANKHRQKFASRLQRLKISSNDGTISSLSSPDVELQDQSFLESLLLDDTFADGDKQGHLNKQVRSETNSPCPGSRLVPLTTCSKSASLNDLPSVVAKNTGFASTIPKKQSPLTIDALELSNQKKAASKNSKPHSPSVQPIPLFSDSKSQVLSKRNSSSQPKVISNAAISSKSGTDGKSEDKSKFVPIPAARSKQPLIIIDDFSSVDIIKCPTPNNTPAASFVDNDIPLFQMERSLALESLSQDNAQSKVVPMPRKNLKSNQKQTPSTTELLSEVCKVVGNSNGPLQS